MLPLLRQKTFNTVPERTGVISGRNTMPAYHKAGVLNTTAVDGRNLRVIYLHDDDSRDEAMINEEVDVLRSFAAACTKGETVIAYYRPVQSRLY